MRTGGKSGIPVDREDVGGDRISENFLVQAEIFVERERGTEGEQFHLYAEKAHAEGERSHAVAQVKGAPPAALVRVFRGHADVLDFEEKAAVAAVLF